MMKIVRATLLLSLVIAALHAPRALAQLAPQQVLLEGLLTQNHRGSFTASAFAPDGSLYLVLDEGDGVRVLKTDSAGSTLAAQLHLGAAGDTASSLAIDPSGNLYIAGTSTSGSLTGSAGVPFPAPADSSQNSFVAKLDPQLNLLFLTFAGSGHTAVSSIAANANAVFLTGSIFSSTLPVTPSALQQTPPAGSATNGFVESFSTDGTTLAYATYLGGLNGDTEAADIAVDSAGHAILAGETSSSGYPTLNALQSAIASSTSGFLTELTPAGDGLVYSTFIAGSGITSVALDPAANALLLTGSLALGDFPVALANSPLTSTPYQSLVELSADGQSVLNGVVLAPGTDSSVAAAPDGSAWITVPLATPLLPATLAAAAQPGDSLLLHVLTTGVFAQSLRFGGAPVGNAGYASLSTSLLAPAVSSDGTRIAAAGAVTIDLSSSLLTTQRFDLSVTSASALLPNSVQDIVPTVVSCGSASQCIGSGALLTLLDPTTSAPTLALSTNDLPSLTLSNPGSAAASSLNLAATGYTLATNCGTSLAPGAQCGLALSGSGPGTLTLSAAGLPSTTVALPATTAALDPLTFSASELDFGIVTAGVPATRTLTLTNLSATAQTFAAAQDAGPSLPAYTLALSSSTCAQAGTNQFTVAPNAFCALTFSLSAASSSTDDGPVHSSWKIGSRDLVLTGFSEAAALSLSATEIDFGQQSPLGTAPHLPRYLFLSNNSQSPAAHAPATLPASSPFAITDACPSTLQPQSVCRLTLTYSSPTAPSLDSATLTLDDGVTVLLTGQTASPQSASGSTADPNVAVSPASLTFTDPVTVTELSASIQGVQITNSGPAAVAVTAAITGDFTLQNQCPATLAAGASCELLVSFAPSQPGVREGLLSVSAGGGFSPTTVTLTGTANAILPSNNGTLSLGSTNIAQPVVTWYAVQAALPSLSVTASNPVFTLALVANSGSNEPPSLPSSAFAAAAAGPCANCWLGIQFLSQTAGTQTATLSLSTLAGGTPEAIALTASATSLSGLVLTPTAASFGSIPVHSSTAPQPFTLTNLLSPAASANITAITATGDFTVLPASTGDCAGSLTATAACTIQIAFAPSAQGTRTGTLTVVTDNGTVTAALTGTGTPDPGLALQPTSLVFNNQAGPAATWQSITITNTSSSTLTIGTPGLPASSFAATSTCSTLAPAAQCTLTITFAPGATLTQTTLTLPVSTGSGAQLTTSSYTLPLSATYTSSSAGLVIMPSQSNLGAAATGSLGSTRQFTLTNITSQPLTITLSLPRQFPLTSSNCSTLVAGATCTLSVALAPAVNGALTGTLAITAKPPSGPALQSLAYLLGYGQGAAALTLTGASSALNFGDVASGQSASQTLTVTNSGSGPLTLHRITSQPPFWSSTSCGATLAPAATCTVTVTYTPINELAAGATGSVRQDTGTLTLESDAVSSPDTLPLTGSATPITTANPASSSVLATYGLSTGALTFPTTQVGNLSSTQSVTLTNTGSSTLHIAAILAPQDFTATSTCGTLLPSATCTLSVEFTPTDLSAQSQRTGTLEVQSDAYDALEFLTLLGPSTPSPLTLSPTALDFGSLTAGQSTQLTVTATNTSSSPITLGPLSATGPYAAASGTCPPSGSTLAAGAQCTLDITFTPTAAGSASGQLSLSSSATELPLTVALTGTGIASTTTQPPASFTLSVNGSSSASLTVPSGQPAAFTLAATPANGFSGPVALTCEALTSAPYASCSLVASTLTLGITAQTSTATVNTLTSNPQSSLRLAGLLLLPLVALAAARSRRTRRKLAGLTLTLLLGIAATSLSACGGATPAQTSSQNLLYTPPGTYQWKVTASSTSGPALSSSVTLTVTVQ